MSQPSDPLRTTPEATGTYPPAAASGDVTSPPSGPSDGAAPTPECAGRCLLLGEIARGGMGVIFRAHDPELGREVAVKVLLESRQDHDDLERRFLEEAQIGGQLQHPGVVPVYDLGRLPDDRPFFTMKLVEGRTLAALIQERDAPAHDLPRFLKIFEQVCQAMAYAHSRGVIHRDLKPANVMVGAFGEVQVMDWGLAKVLKPGGVHTIRSGEPGAKSAAGAVLGTPAYMAPEQACGDVDALDARCDVFGLGAMLCEVLTGAPPYRGRDKAELLRQARRGDLSDAFARLEACGADAELVRLAKACLTAEPAGRPADAGAVAAAATAYLAGVQERLRQAELGQAAAQARAAEERKRRRLTAALAATVLLAVAGAGAVALWVQQDHAARADADSRRAAAEARRAAATERDVTAALDEAEALGRQAKTLTDDPTKWEAALAEALAAVKRADDLLKTGPGTDELRARVGAERTELEAADRDRRMVARLEEARLRFAEGGPGGFDRAGAAALYAAAFRDDGMDLASLDAGQAAERINQRAIREELLAGLEDWAWVAPDKDEARRLHQVVQAADPDPGSFRNRCQALVDRKDWDGLRGLAFGPGSEGLSAATLYHLGQQVLFGGGSAVAAAEFLKEANERRPGDFWILFGLGEAWLARRPQGTDEALRYYTAAIALRPRSAAAHQNLGVTFDARGRPDEAVAEYRKAIDLNPRLAHGHANLARTLLYVFGRPDEAIPELHEQLEINPNEARTYLDLGHALREQGRFSESRTAVRRYEELRPKRAGDSAPSAEWRRAEDLVRLDALLPTVLAGAAEPSTPAARVDFAEVCLWKRRCGESARLFARAFADEPGLAENLSSGVRYNAARAAALAGCGRGEGAAAIDAEERGRWRKQALDWLRADLALRTKKIDGGGPNAADARTLRRWQVDADLSGVRDADALEKLPPEEQGAWRKLWADVDAQLKKAQAK